MESFYERDRMGIVKNEQEIKAEIAALENLNQTVDLFPIFYCDDHFDVQIEVLAKKIDADGILKRWPVKSPDVAWQGPAFEALHWRNGHNGYKTPSKSWISFLRKWRSKCPCQATEKYALAGSVAK